MQLISCNFLWLGAVLMSLWCCLLVSVAVLLFSGCCLLVSVAVFLVLFAVAGCCLRCFTGADWAAFVLQT